MSESVLLRGLSRSAPLAKACGLADQTLHCRRTRSPVGRAKFPPLHLGPEWAWPWRGHAGERGPRAQDTQIAYRDMDSTRLREASITTCGPGRGACRSRPRENSQIGSHTFDGKGESAHHGMGALWVRKWKVAPSDKRFLLN